MRAMGEKIQITCKMNHVKQHTGESHKRPLVRGARRRRNELSNSWTSLNEYLDDRLWWIRLLSSWISLSNVSMDADIGWHDELLRILMVAWMQSCNSCCPLLTSHNFSLWNRIHSLIVLSANSRTFDCPLPISLLIDPVLDLCSLLVCAM